MFSGKAFEITENGRYLAYVTFNASKTSYFSYAKYGPSEHQYPIIDRIAYPKVSLLLTFALLSCVTFVKKP